MFRAATNRVGGDELGGDELGIHARRCEEQVEEDLGGVRVKRLRRSAERDALSR